jgi:hypothetical protein
MSTYDRLFQFSPYLVKGKRGNGTALRFRPGTKQQKGLIYVGLNTRYNESGPK